MRMKAPSSADEAIFPEIPLRRMPMGIQNPTRNLSYADLAANSHPEAHSARQKRRKATLNQKKKGRMMKKRIWSLKLVPHLAKEAAVVRKQRTALPADAPVCADESLNPVRLPRRQKNSQKNSKTFVVAATAAGPSKKLCMKSRVETARTLIIV
jgi:hypothetical protein